jgi:hypothetical protein
MPIFVVKIPGQEDVLRIPADDMAYDQYNLELTAGDRVIAYFKDWSYVWELPAEESPDVVPVDELAEVVVRSGLDSR